MRYYLTLILFIFLGCAAQLKPKGGPVDNEGPRLVKVSHPNLTNISNSTDKIILYFDEFIEPLSVVNAIEIMNIDDFEYMVRGKKIIINTNHFKIIPPHVVKKIKRNTEIHPYWNYLFTKFSTQNKISYYVKKRRIHGSSKFNIFTLNPWIAFFSGIHCFRKRFINIILSLLLVNILILILTYYKFYSAVLILFLILFSCLF